MNEKKSQRQSRSWILTIPEKFYGRADVEQALANYVYLGQLEQGKSGYRHWQLLIENRSAIRFTTLKNQLPKAHIEPRAGTVAQAVEYVTKDETRVPGEPPLSNGRIVVSDEKGHRKDVEVVREAVLESQRSFDDIILNVPQAARMQGYVRELIAARDREASRGVIRDVSVTYLYGEPGTGKTRWVFENFSDMYRVTNYKHPFDSYAGEKTLVLDEFTGQLEITELNNVLDVYPLELPARYANRPAMFTNVIIVSNFAPWDLYKGYSAGLRKAFVRRIDHTKLMDDGTPVEVIRDSVLARFGAPKNTSPPLSEML